MVKKLKIILLFVVVSLSCINFLKASSSVSFEIFVDDVSLVEQNKSKISIMKFMSDFNKIKTKKCDINYFDSYIEVSPVCFLPENEISSLSFEEYFDYFLDDLNGFSNLYQDSKSFSYRSVSPYYDDKKFNLYRYYKGSIYEKILITYLEIENMKVRISKSTFTKIMSDKFSFYVVPTYLSNRGNCSLINYRLAISKLDNLELLPGQDLNLNSLISYDSRACKGILGNNYMFFAGSCGASTQLFRLSLIVPYLDVVERNPHSKWWAYYYGNEISGDDAAMFENSQRFIIKNSFDVPIYFKVYEQGDFSYLVGIVGKKVEDYVEVNKFTEGLSSSVHKRIYDGFGNLLDIYQFDSRYMSKYLGKS